MLQKVWASLVEFGVEAADEDFGSYELAVSAAASLIVYKGRGFMAWEMPRGPNGGAWTTRFKRLLETSIPSLDERAWPHHFQSDSDAIECYKSV